MTESRFERLILLIKQGDRQGLREIYDEYGKMIFSAALSVAGNRHDAEDITSDFFIKLWEKLADTYKFGGGHKRWLVAAARNCAIDYLRRNGREVLSLDDDDEDSPHDIADNTDAENTVIGDMTVREALCTLSVSEREIVNMKLFADLTFDDIAKTLGKPLGTVAWKYRTALKKLERCIKEVRSDE